MIKNKMFLCLLVLAVTSLFYNCKDSVENTTTIDATLNGKVADAMALSINSILNYEFNIQSTGTIAKVQMFKSVAGVESPVAIAGEIKNQTAKIVGSIEITSDIQLRLTATDSKGNETTKTVKFNIYLTTQAATEMTYTTAKSGGKIADGVTGVTSRGVVWSTSPAPTVSLTTKTSDGAGSGSYTSAISGLSPATTYYLRSYAATGTDVIYGNEITFSTLTPPVPAIPNGGFEAPSISGLMYTPPTTGWKFEGGGAGIQHNGSAFGASTAPEGVQTAFFQGGSAWISQTVDFTAGNFALSFMVAARPPGEKQIFKVYFDNTLIGTVTPASTSFQYFVSDVFSATAGPHLIMIKAATTGGDSGFIDDVKLVWKP